MHLVHVHDIPAAAVDVHLGRLQTVSRVLLQWAHARAGDKFVLPEHLPADFRARWRHQAVFRDMTVRRHPNGLDVCRARAAVQFDYCKRKSASSTVCLACLYFFSLRLLIAQTPPTSWRTTSSALR